MSAFMASFNVSPSVTWDYLEASIYLTKLHLLYMHVQIEQLSFLSSLRQVNLNIQAIVQHCHIHVLEQNFLLAIEM